MKPVFAFFVFVLSTGMACGAERALPERLKPLELGGVKIATPSVALPFLLEAMERGMPLLSVTGDKPEIGSMESQAEADRKAGVLIAQDALDWAENRGLSKNKNAAEVAAAPAALEPVSPWDGQSRTRFLDCAKQTLPLLKSWLRAQENGETELVLVLASLIQKERGDGVHVTPEGLACGKYLGAKGFAVSSPVEDVKWLSALWLLGPDNSGWKVFALFGKLKRGERLHAPAFWNFAWRKTAFAAVIRKKNLSKIETLLGAFETENQRQKVQSVGFRQGALQDWKNLHSEGESK